MKHGIRDSNLVAIIGLLSLVLGGTLLAISLQPYTTIKAALDSLAMDGEAAFLSADRHLLLAGCAAALGIALSAQGIVVLRLRRRVIEWVAALTNSVDCTLARCDEVIRRFRREEERVHLVAIATVLIAGIAIRAPYLNQPIRSDEAYTYMNFASKPLLQGVSDYSAPNNHLFHTVLVHIAIRLLGSEPWVIRLPAFLAGISIPGLTYVFGRILIGKETGLLASAFAAISSILIEYSTYARGYSLVTAITLLMLIDCAFIQRHTNLVGWSFFVALSIIGFATIPTMIYPWTIGVVWMGAGFAWQRQWLRIAELALAGVLAAAGTLAAYFPAFLVTGIDQIVRGSYVIPLSWGQFVDRFPASLLAVLTQWHRGLPLPARIFLGAGLAVSPLAIFRGSRRLTSLVLAIVVASGLLPVVHRVVPFPRVWQFLVPVYFTLASAGIWLVLGRVGEWLGVRRSLLASASTAVIIVGLGTAFLIVRPSYLPEDGFEDAAAVTTFLAERLQEGDKVVAAVPAISPLEYYFARAGISLGVLYTDYSNARQLYVIVDRRRQTLETVLEWAEVPSGFEKPCLIEEFGAAMVYRAVVIP